MLDISKIGLTDLRQKITIIPQDPTILSGTLRSTLDVFGQYEDAEIYEALRRVHLLPADGTGPAATVDAEGNEVSDRTDAGIRPLSLNPIDALRSLSC